MTEHQEIWCQPGDAAKRQFIIFFDDPSQDIATFDDEDEARAFWERASIDWNCYLLGTLPRQKAKPEPRSIDPVAWMRDVDDGYVTTRIPRVAEIWRDQGCTVTALYAGTSDRIAKGSADE